MSSYRYHLSRSSKKHVCPQCGKRRFKFYYDTLEARELPDFGRCDREEGCKYHLHPSSVRRDTDEVHVKIVHPAVPAFGIIPQQVFDQTLHGYTYNTFINNLIQEAGESQVQRIEQLVGLYYLGTVQGSYMTGAISLPFIDTAGRVRAVQEKLFDEHNHTIKTNWLHSRLKYGYTHRGEQLPQWLDDYEKAAKRVSCLFGAHLLPEYPTHKVALVEAPKTALYAALALGLPDECDTLWLAVFNLSSLSLDKCISLAGRDVVLFPDVSKDGAAFTKWSTQAEALGKQMTDTRFIVSDLLEQIATEQDREQGTDLADYVQQAFAAQQQRDEVSRVKSVKSVTKVDSDARHQPHRKPQECKQMSRFESVDEVVDPWDSLAETLTFLNILDICATYAPHPWMRITDMQKYIDTHVSILEANAGNNTYLPYLERIQSLASFARAKT